MLPFTQHDRQVPGWLAPYECVGPGAVTAGYEFQNAVHIRSPRNEIEQPWGKHRTGAAAAICVEIDHCVRRTGVLLDRGAFC